MTTMDDTAVAQGGTPIPTGTVMVAQLVGHNGVVCEWRPISGASDADEFARWAGDYLASMAAEGMAASVVVEAWPAARWRAFRREAEQSC